MSNIKGKKLASGSAMRTLEFIVGAIIALAVTPLMIHSLGDKMFGLWVIIGSIVGYYGLMDFGLGSAVARYISRAAGINDHSEINKIVNTALGIFTIIGSTILVISFVIAIYGPVVIKNITEVNTFRTAIVILGVSMALRFPFSVFMGILGAHVRYDLISTLEIIALFIRTFFIVIILKMGYGIGALVCIVFISDICRYIAYYLISMHVYPSIKVSLKLFDVDLVKKLFGYSVYTFFASIADELRFNVDNLVIVIFIGLNPVTLYSIGARLIRNFMMLMSSAMGVTMPVFSQYEGKGDYDSIREKYLFFMKISAYLAIFIGGLLIILGKAFIIRWVGVEYEKAYYILLILLIPFIFAVMQIPGNSVLYGISKHKYYSISNTIEGVCNLALSIFLVRLYGLYGVALGTAIPMFIIKVFIQPVYTCKVINLQVRKFYIDLMLPIILLSSVTLVLFWLIVKEFIRPQYPNLFIIFSCASVFYIAIVYIFGFGKQEKAMIERVLFQHRKM